MSRGNQRNNNIQHGNQQPNNITPELFEKFLEQQQLRLQIEAQRLKLEEKQLEQDGKLAEQSLTHNAEFLKNQPAESRKTITRIAYIIAGILVICFAFIILCLYMDKEEFVDRFLSGLSYVVTSIISGWVGTKIPKKSKKDSDDIEDAQVQD